MRLAWACVFAAAIVTVGVANTAEASHRWDTETELFGPDGQIRLDEPHASATIELELAYRYPNQALSVSPTTTELALVDPTGSLETALVPATVEHESTNHPSKRDPEPGRQQQETADIRLDVSRNASFGKTYKRGGTNVP